MRRAVPAASVSSPAFFRVIDERRPTLMIDEGEKLLKLNRHLEPMLNAGYKEATAYVWRVVNQSAQEARRKRKEEGGEWGEEETEGGNGGSGQTTMAFSCWCPKIIARIGPLSETLADRCLVLRMTRKRPDQKCERLKKLNWEPLRKQCEQFVRENAEAIKEAEPEIPGKLNDREAELWEPLLAIADLAGKWRRLGREAAVHVAGNRENNRAAAALLSDILMIFARSGAERMFSRTLAAQLNELGDREWKELREGKVLTGQTLAKALHPYGIAPQTVWIGKESAKGYLREKIVEVRGKYPRAEPEQEAKEGRDLNPRESRQEGGRIVTSASFDSFFQCATGKPGPYDTSGSPSSFSSLKDHGSFRRDFMRWTI